MIVYISTFYSLCIMPLQWLLTCCYFTCSTCEWLCIDSGSCRCLPCPVKLFILCQFHLYYRVCCLNYVYHQILFGMFCLHLVLWFVEAYNQYDISWFNCQQLIVKVCLLVKVFCIAVTVIAGCHWHIKFTSDTLIDPALHITVKDVTNLFRSQASLNVIFVSTQVSALWS